MFRLLPPKGNQLPRAFGLWLNRKRSFYRDADATAFGGGINAGTISPGSPTTGQRSPIAGEALTARVVRLR